MEWGRERGETDVAQRITTKRLSRPMSNLLLALPGGIAAQANEVQVLALLRDV
jgi:hypothetical protein